MISIVVPVFNEASILKKNILQLFEFCQNSFQEDWQIIISDNSSSDRTPVLSQELSVQYPAIKYFHLSQRGKGLAVITAWQKFPADIYVFMDVDLAVDLSALPSLVTALRSGSDIAVGSRFLGASQVERSFGRRLVSFGLHLILKIFFHLQVADAPCGFKAVNQKVITQIIPLIKNQTWFFDTELLVLAEKKHFLVQEIPVIWREQKSSARQSKVSLLRVIVEYLKNIYQLRRRLNQ